jgi:flavorubredoxin
MSEIIGGEIERIEIDLDSPSPLYASDSHAVYWLGITEETPFRCNAYLIRDGAQAIIVDPGNRAFFDQVRGRVAQILDPTAVTGMVLCHQDPDVAASMIDWLDLNPAMRVFASPRTHVLLPHYGRAEYHGYDVTDEPRLELPSGACLRFVEAPFLHFPGAVATYDSASGFLFSGDIWAALDVNWKLTVESFEDHVPMMDLFHMDYMASNIAARGFVERLRDIHIEAILPQHGSIITKPHVRSALEYLRNLRCGTDIVYANLA